MGKARRWLVFARFRRGRARIAKRGNRERRTHSAFIRHRRGAWALPKQQSHCFSHAAIYACSFNPTLIRRMAAASAKEISADGLHQTFSPVLCLGRDIRWGRVNETFGEDPYLAGELGAAMVEG